MHKIKDKKITLLIVSFSILLTSLFIILVYYFQSNYFNFESGETLFYSLSSKDMELILNQNKIDSLNPNQFINSNIYNQFILEKQLKTLIPLGIIFFFSVIILSFLLWFFIQKVLVKQNKEIAFKIKNINEKTDDFSNNPILNSAYINMKEKFDNALNDYKKLNSYLSHEQKNEIALLKTNLVLDGNDETAQKLDKITDSINDILTLSENLGVENCSCVDVTLICAELCDQYRKIQENIFFEFSDDDCIIFAREMWIYRVVSNLIDNAIKYGKGKDIILDVQNKKGSVIIKVSDLGIGISEKEQELIFTDRYRINELKKDGYGIGLSLINHVCNLCGGFVTLESEKDKGTTFYLAFPSV